MSACTNRVAAEPTTDDVLGTGYLVPAHRYHGYQQSMAHLTPRLFALLHQAEMWKRWCIEEHHNACQLCACVLRGQNVVLSSRLVTSIAFSQPSLYRCSGRMRWGLLCTLHTRNPEIATARYRPPRANLVLQGMHKCSAGAGRNWAYRRHQPVPGFYVRMIDSMATFGLNLR